MYRLDLLMNAPDRARVLAASRASPSTENKKVCGERGPFRHTYMSAEKALILLAHMCYKRLL
jgi:hypothetical protein